MNLFERFEVLDDPRDIRGERYKLIDILVMTIYGLLCGLKDFTNIADFMKLKEEYFTQLLDLENGTPSHDCLSDVFASIDSKKFMEIFIEWTKDILEKKTGRKISIDGKAIKSATDKINNGNIPYIVSAFSQELGLSIGQVKVDDKSNEITAIPELLDLINIEECVVTIDAIGTQKNIVEKIVNKKAHYCLSVKSNQKSLFTDIDEYFKFALEDKEELSKLKYSSSINKNHGRIEKRECYVCNNIDFIYDKNLWTNLKTIILVRNYRELYDDLSIDDRYYISDLDLSADEFSNIVRKHWSIENNLHWILDVYFKEDLSLARKDNAISNFSIIRKICYNLTNLDDNLKHLTIKKRLANYQYDITNIEKLLISIFNNN